MKKFLGIEPRNFCGSSEAPATAPSAPRKLQAPATGLRGAGCTSISIRVITKLNINF
ncbi:MAG: hypothetical protein K2K81_11185 [Muribaculaceae bacterium]|nr:hypothetical protein [Muribaculaceae bacterium]